ncbi:MAG: ABC transporter substrate-binding protein [Christensenellales bacterium]|jgi:putative aldouronate transport system substrate-binding protein
MGKRSMAWILALILGIVSFAGCSTGIAAANDERVTIQWYAAGATFDTTQINEKATEMLNAAGINVDFKLNWLGWDTYSTTVTNMIASGEPFDIFNQSIAVINTYALSNGIYEITEDDLTNYLSGAVEAMGRTLFDNCRYNGHLYAVPVAHEFAQWFGIQYNEKMAEELGLDMSKYNTRDDLDELFAYVHENVPEDIYVLSLPECNRPFMVLADMNYINNSETICMCMDLTDDSKGIFNPFEDEKMVTALRKVNEWIDKDYCLTDNTVDYISLNRTEGKVFCTIKRTKPGAVEQESTAFVTSQLKLLSDKHYATFNDFPGGWGNAISATSEHPDVAMQVLNYVYTTPEMMDLLTFGIEGIDYTRDGDGYIILAESGYSADVYGSANWQMGNHYLCSVTTLQVERGMADIWSRLKEFNDTATVLDSTGFFFDTTKYEAEITAVANTHTEYWSQLYYGQTDDFDSTLAEFNEELYANGLQTLLDACREQYEDYLSTK